MTASPATSHVSSRKFLVLPPSLAYSPWDSKPNLYVYKPLIRTSTFHVIAAEGICNFRQPARALDRGDQYAIDAVDLFQKYQGVEQSVKVLKDAAKTRRVAAEEVLAALNIIKQAKIEPSTFLDTLGGQVSPGRTWMLIFTAQDRLKRGSYFPVTAVQRFDAAAKRIENGVYLGPLGCLTFEGRLSWNKRILAFVFQCIKIKVGPLGPLQINFGRQDREPNTKDPFFIWFYVDEEIAVAQGRGGGTAFWCRCRRVRVN